ncbi:MAG: DASS family sodium-coupled anion symporter [Bacteroidota bacterium]
MSSAPPLIDPHDAPEAVVSEPLPDGPEPGLPGGRVRMGGLLAGLVLGGGLLALPTPEGLDVAAWRTLAIGVLMAVWWMTEAMPLAATSLVPLVAFPLVGIAVPADAAAPYANPIIFLFLSGFLLAKGLERWGLHRRIALGIVSRLGVSPYRIVAGFLVAAGGLSMWISNTATAVMMLPIGLSIIALTEDPGQDRRGGFAVALMLAIAYACSVGGMATLIGTPTNALLAAFVLDSYGVEVSFAGWMALGLPLALGGLGLLYVMLTRVAFDVSSARIPGGQAFVDTELRSMGRMSSAERRVAVVFGTVALLWITRQLWQPLAPGVNDTVIGMAGALALFALPAGQGRGDARLLDWPSAVTLPWGVLLLFGGGLSLAAAIKNTGLAAWIGGSLAAVSAWPLVLLVGLTVLVIVLLTEMTSNTATAAAFLPVLAALPLGADPMLLLAAATLAASCAFMLPVATPPNAIVYGSDRITLPQMARAGVWLNLLFAVLVTLWCLLVVPLLAGGALPVLN